MDVRLEEKEELFTKEDIGESSKTDFKSGVSFAPNLISSTPKKADIIDPRSVDDGLIKNKPQEGMSFFPEQTYSYA